MTTRVYYHHPDDSRYSLAYVTQDRAEITTSGQDAIVEHYDLDEEFFVLYTNCGASGTVGDLDDEFEDVLDEMSPQDRTITVRLLQIFEEIVEEKELEEEQKLEIYKQIELERIPDAIARVDWTGTAVDVAGQLMSTLILKHALPNANHRTSISIAQWYLESIETGFSFPDFATEAYDWKTWVNEYITESKRLLTVRRNTTAFSLLSKWGCDTVVRKNGTRSFLQSTTST
jgi:prophage maintenance system killer protein